jgi:hypothetical protein
VCLYWLVSGRTVGGTPLYDVANRLDRTAALRLWTEGSAWFSTENGQKGRLAVGQLGDVAVLSDDYFGVADESIKGIRSVLTIVGGRIVHADGAFGALAPPMPTASPDWSPVNRVGGDVPPLSAQRVLSLRAPARCTLDHRVVHGLWGPAGCGCFAF